MLAERAKIEDQALLAELKNSIKQEKTTIDKPLSKDSHSNKQNAELFLVQLMLEYVDVFYLQLQHIPASLYLLHQ